MDDKTRCPICGDGRVTDHMAEIEAEYKGHKAMVSSHFQLCDACGSDFAGALEMHSNKCAMHAFRKRIAGDLTKEKESTP